MTIRGALSNSLICGCVCLLVVATAGAADDGLPDPALPVFDLGLLVVSAPPAPPIAGTVETETAAEISRQNDRDVTDTLARMSGVTITTGTKNEARVLLRGFNQDKVPVLIDGVPVTSPYYGDFDLSELPVDALAAVRIVKGNASPLYGPNALGGVIELVSPLPKEGLGLHFDSLYDSNGTYDLAGLASYRQGAYYALLGGSRADRDEWELSDDFEEAPNEAGGARDFSDYERNAGAVRAGAEWDAGAVSLAYRNVDAAKGIPPSTVDSRPRFWDFPEWKMTTLTLSGRMRAGEAASVRGSLYRHTWDNVLEAFADAEHSELEWTSTYDDQAWGGWLQGETVLGELSALTVGAMFKDSEHRAQDDLGEPWQAYSSRTYNLAASFRTAVIERFRFEADLGYSLLDPTESSETEPGDTIDALDPVAAVEWQAGEFRTLRFSAGRHTRFPTMNELYATVSGNPDLDPEHALNFDLEYRCTPSAGELRANLFYSRVRDLIDRPTRDDLYVNMDRATIRGLELAGRTRLAPVWIELAYTWTDTIDHSNDDRDLPHVPDHAGRLAAGVELATGTEIDAAVRLFSSSSEYDRDGVQIEIDGAALVELGVRQRIYRGLALHLRARNLLDENYEEEFGYPAPGRTLEGGLSFDL